MKHLKGHELLVPIDEIICDLQTRIIDHEWNDDFDRADSCKYLLEHYLKEREKGVIYEPLF